MSSDYKSKVRRIVSERNLCSCMNDTKWNELRNAMMDEMPFSPAYCLKFVDSDYVYNEEAFESGLTGEMSWYEVYAIEGVCFNGAFAVEWIKICPVYYRKRGELLPPETVSAEQELADILKKYNIPYEENNGIYTVYGYR